MGEVYVYDKWTEDFSTTGLCGTLTPFSCRHEEIAGGMSGVYGPMGESKPEALLDLETGLCTRRGRGWCGTVSSCTFCAGRGCGMRSRIWRRWGSPPSSSRPPCPTPRGIRACCWPALVGHTGITVCGFGNLYRIAEGRRMCELRFAAAGRINGVHVDPIAARWDIVQGKRISVI